MEQHAIDVSGSSCVGFACYYPQSQTLRLGFVGGEAYDYLRVPPSVIAEFAAAESKGRFVNEVIKRFRYERTR